MSLGWIEKQGNRLRTIGRWDPFTRIRLPSQLAAAVPSGWPKFQLSDGRSFVACARVGCIWFLGLAVFAPPTPRSFFAFFQRNPSIRAIYGNHIYSSLRLVYAFSLTTFVWNIACIVVLAWAVQPHLLLGLVDVTMFSGLIYGQSRIRTWIPASNSTCTNSSSVSQWQKPDGAELGLFPYVAKLQRGNSTPLSVCSAFINVREAQESLIIEEGIIALFCLLLTMPTGSPLHLYTLVKIIALVIFVPTREFIEAIQFLFRYSQRLRVADNNLTAIELQSLYHKHSNLSDGRDYQSSNPKLEQVLSIEHLLEPIASNLCYTDLISLSRTSRLIRELVIPGHDLAFRRSKLHAWSCSGASPSSRTRCWNCNLQLCAWCSTADGHTLPDAPMAAHLTKCKPACTLCYYLSVSRRERASKSCTCRRPNAQLPRSICRFCDEAHFASRCQRHALAHALARSPCLGKHAPDTVAGSLRTLRLRAELQNAAAAQPCSRCGKRFREAQRRWWICSVCQSECRDPCHPSHPTALAAAPGAAGSTPGLADARKHSSVRATAARWEQRGTAPWRRGAGAQVGAGQQQTVPNTTTSAGG